MEENRDIFDFLIKTPDILAKIKIEADDIIQRRKLYFNNHLRLLEIRIKKLLEIKIKKSDLDDEGIDKLQRKRDHCKWSCIEMEYEPAKSLTMERELAKLWDIRQVGILRDILLEKQKKNVNQKQDDVFLNFLNTKNKMGRTALIEAVIQGWSLCVEVLLETGADFLLTDDQYGRSALFWAVIQGHEHCLEVILKHIAFHKEYKENKKKKRALLNSYDNQGYVLLHHAVALNFPNCVGLLLAEDEIDISLVTKSAEKQTVFHLAAKQILLHEQEKGKELKNSFALLPMKCLGLLVNFMERFKMDLLNHKTQDNNFLNCRDSEQKTALDYLIDIPNHIPNYIENWYWVKALIESGADITQTKQLFYYFCLRWGHSWYLEGALEFFCKDYPVLNFSARNSLNQILDLTSDETASVSKGTILDLALKDPCKFEHALVLYEYGAKCMVSDARKLRSSNEQDLLASDEQVSFKMLEGVSLERSKVKELLIWAITKNYLNVFTLLLKLKINFIEYLSLLSYIKTAKEIQKATHYIDLFWVCFIETFESEQDYQKKIEDAFAKLKPRLIYDFLMLTLKQCDEDGFTVYHRKILGSDLEHNKLHILLNCFQDRLSIQRRKHLKLLFLTASNSIRETLIHFILQCAFVNGKQDLLRLACDLMELGLVPCPKEILVNKSCQFGATPLEDFFAFFKAVDDANFFSGMYGEFLGKFLKLGHVEAVFELLQSNKRNIKLILDLETSVNFFALSVRLLKESIVNHEMEEAKNILKKILNWGGKVRPYLYDFYQAMLTTGFYLTSSSPKLLSLEAEGLKASNNETFLSGLILITCELFIQNQQPLLSALMKMQIDNKELGLVLGSYMSNAAITINGELLALNFGITPAIRLNTALIFFNLILKTSRPADLGQQLLQWFSPTSAERKNIEYETTKIKKQLSQLNGKRVNSFVLDESGMGVFIGTQR
jgi:hypothetical protein